MPKYAQQFSAHPVHRNINNAFGLIETASEFAEASSTDAWADLQRVRDVLSFTRNKLSASDPHLCPISILSNIDSYIQQLVAELQAYIGDKNTSRLASMNVQADAILTIAHTIPIPQNGIELRELREALVAFRQSAGQHTRHLASEVSEVTQAASNLSKELQSMLAEINSQKGRADSVISDLQKNFAESEARRGEQFLNNENTRTQENQKSFRALEDAVAQKEETRSGDFNTLKKNFESLMSTAKTELTSDAEEILADIEGHKHTAEKLVTVITNTGMVGGYQKNANRERLAAVISECLAGVALVGLIIFALWAFHAGLTVQSDWTAIVARGFVAITFGFLAAYASKQSDKHRLAERRDRQMELELASIDPYLLNFPPEKQQQIKEEIARRMFAQADTTQIQTEKSVSIPTVDVIERLSKLLETAIKAIGK